MLRASDRARERRPRPREAHPCRRPPSPADLLLPPRRRRRCAAGLAGRRERVAWTCRASARRRAPGLEAHGFKGAARKLLLLPGAGRQARRRAARHRRRQHAAIRQGPARCCADCCRRNCRPGVYELAGAGADARAGRDRLGARRLPVPPLQDRQRRQRRRSARGCKLRQVGRPRPRAGDRRGGVAGPRPDQYAGLRHGTGRARSRRARARRARTARASRRSSATTCWPRISR